MDTFDTHDLGLMAAKFLDNLEGDAGTKDREWHQAVFVVADLDDEGDVRVAMRTSSTDGLTNIQVLQAAQLAQTQAMIGRR
jgi:hypothetical protein